MIRRSFTQYLIFKNENKNNQKPNQDQIESV